MAIVNGKPYRVTQACVRATQAVLEATWGCVRSTQAYVIATHVCYSHTGTGGNKVTRVGRPAGDGGCGINKVCSGRVIGE